MAHAPTTTGHSAQLETTTGLDHRKLVMWIFLGSECLFFGTLISTYLVYRNKSLVGPYPEDIINVPVTSISTFVLLMSSFMMVMTLYSIRNGNDRAFRVWVLGTALLGSTFLGFQVFEFREFANHEVVIHCASVRDDQSFSNYLKDLSVFERGVVTEARGDCLKAEGGQPPDEVVVQRGLTPRTNLFGTTFFILTGFHGAHVTLGVIWLVSLFGQSMLGQLKKEDALRVEIAGLYWHFVDIVWIAIFTLIYLIGGKDGPEDVQVFLNQGFELVKMGNA